MTGTIADSLVTGALSYLAIGALLWMLLETSGHVGLTYQKWAARGEAPSATVMVIAAALVILSWPLAAYGFVCGMLSELRGRQ